MKTCDTPNETAVNDCRNGWRLQTRLSRLFLGLLLWFSFVKLPATIISAERPPQPWEPVMSYAATHHLQWGRDIVFTYGPLGFLTTDYYWGGYFWPILLWAFGFSLFLTIVLMRFLERVASPIRVVLCVLLPWLTVPHWEDLGIDPIYLFAIAVIGVASLPDKRPSLPSLAVLGAALGCLSLTKFTFCLYSIFTLLTVVTTQGLNRHWRAAGVITGSLVSSFLAAWLLAGQNVCNIGRWFQHGAQIAGAYSSAMAIVPPASEMIRGVLLSLGLLGLLLAQWLNAGKLLNQFPKVLLLAVGIFLAWKEGFVRADLHINVFLLYAFVIAAMMPALLGVAWKKNSAFLPLTLATMILALLPYTPLSAKYMVAAKDGLLPKLTDTVTAVFAPLRLRHLLDAQLESMRQANRLPKIAAIVGDAPVGVLNYDQDVAILNGFNYRPHPVFQNYAAHTPELERMNSAFFDSPAAPEFLLWRFGTIDRRFPTLDDGRIILNVLADYSPVLKEDKYVLWKRNEARRPSYSLAAPDDVLASADQWIPIPADATWLEVELHETWFGSFGRFFCRGAMPEIDVRLADGRTVNYFLPPGNARAGFIINPLLHSEAGLEAPFLGHGQPARVVAAKVRVDRWCFEDSIRFEMREIKGVPALQIKPEALP